MANNTIQKFLQRIKRNRIQPLQPLLLTNTPGSSLRISPPRSPGRNYLRTSPPRNSLRTSPPRIPRISPPKRPRTLPPRRLQTLSPRRRPRTLSPKRPRTSPPKRRSVPKVLNRKKPCIYCGNNLLSPTLQANGGDCVIGTNYQCLKKGIGYGMHSPIDLDFINYEPIDQPENIYCGDSRPLPDQYERFGRRSSCLRKGVGVGKRIKIERENLN